MSIIFAKNIKGTAYAVPFSDGVNDGNRTHDSQSHNLVLYQLSYIHRMAYLGGFEPSTYCLEGSCSIRLS